MATTEHFYVSTKDNKIRNTTEPTREYFLPDGKKKGLAKYIIEVFGNNHIQTAMRVRDMVDKSEMSDKLFLIRVETK